MRGRRWKGGLKENECLWKFVSELLKRCLVLTKGRVSEQIRVDLGMGGGCLSYTQVKKSHTAKQREWKIQVRIGDGCNPPPSPKGCETFCDLGNIKEVKMKIEWDLRWCCSFCPDWRNNTQIYSYCFSHENAGMQAKCRCTECYGWCAAQYPKWAL